MSAVDKWFILFVCGWNLIGLGIGVIAISYKLWQ